MNHEFLEEKRETEQQRIEKLKPRVGAKSTARSRKRFIEHCVDIAFSKEI